MSSYSDVFKRTGLLNQLLSSAVEKLEGSELETLSLVLEQDHFHMLLEGMKEVKEKKIVSFQSAFSDLD